MDHVSFWTDLRVVFITVKKVLGQEDINSASSATMEAFNGQN